MPEENGSHVATEAFHILRTLYQLSTDLASSENRQDLIFRILNNTVRLFPYRRAVLWSFDEKKPKLLGVSGRDNVNDKSPLASHWRNIVLALNGHKKVQIIDGSLETQQEAWRDLEEKTNGLSVLWVPVVVGGKIRAGLWMERWGADVWDAGESEIMHSFAENVGLTWKQFNPVSRWKSQTSRRLRYTVNACLGVIILCLLLFYSVPLRVVAPCEIVPEDPQAIAAPLEGVINQVWVQPGDKVKEGDLLFSYEDRIVKQELKVAQKQVQIVKAQYERMRLRAFQDNRAMEEVRSLKYRLEQEEIRLKLAEANARHLEVRAPVSGICMLDDPEHWQGRPVQIGERVIRIFQPEKGKVRIFLPENDYIAFDWKKTVQIILNADPGGKREAWLSYISPQASKNPEGGAAFIAEAHLADQQGSVRIGSKGSAIVAGEEVSLGYWLARKPLAGLRRFLGV